MKKKNYFHENNSKGGAFNGKGGHKLHIKNAKTGTLKKPELIEKSYTLFNQFGPYSLSKYQLSLAY